MAGIGTRIAPLRFLAFFLLLPACAWLFHRFFPLREAVMLGFDVAAMLFLLSLWPLLRETDARSMRRRSRDNDANRGLLLILSALVTFIVLVSVLSELMTHGAGRITMPVVILTLALAWIFSNMVYALHYAHLFYAASEADAGQDAGGLDFPETKEPGYWDFIYFSFTLGMTFQTSDVGITRTGIRRLATLHSFAAFVFNLGVLAFTINILGG